MTTLKKPFALVVAFLVLATSFTIPTHTRAYETLQSVSNASAYHCYEDFLASRDPEIFGTVASNAPGPGNIAPRLTNMTHLRMSSRGNADSEAHFAFNHIRSIPAGGNARTHWNTQGANGQNRVATGTVGIAVDLLAGADVNAPWPLVDTVVIHASFVNGEPFTAPTPTARGVGRVSIQSGTRAAFVAQPTNNTHQTWNWGAFTDNATDIGNLDTMTANAWRVVGDTIEIGDDNPYRVFVFTLDEPTPVRYLRALIEVVVPATPSDPFHNIAISSFEVYNSRPGVVEPPPPPPPPHDGITFPSFAEFLTDFDPNNTGFFGDINTPGDNNMAPLFTGMNTNLRQSSRGNADSTANFAFNHIRSIPNGVNNRNHWNTQGANGQNRTTTGTVGIGVDLLRGAPANTPWPLVDTVVLYASFASNDPFQPPQAPNLRGIGRVSVQSGTHAAFSAQPSADTHQGWNWGTIHNDASGIGSLENETSNMWRVIDSPIDIQADNPYRVFVFTFEEPTPVRYLRALIEILVPTPSPATGADGGLASQISISAFEVFNTRPEAPSGLEVSPSPHGFPSLLLNYPVTNIPTGEITITNHDIPSTGTLYLSTSSPSFTVAPATLPSLGVGDSATFVISPIHGLPLGNHAGTITIADEGGNALATLDTSVAVVESAPTLTPAFSPAGAPIVNQPVQPPRVAATIVSPNYDGTLTYNPWDTHDSLARGIPGETGHRLEGNIMPDFSRVGFREGLEDIPFLHEGNSYVVRLYPNASGDDTARINAAIQHVGNQPVSYRGFRGVVELAPGTFRISGVYGIELNRSGVVLRGSGQGPDGTILAYEHRPEADGASATHGFRNDGVAITLGTAAYERLVPGVSDSSVLLSNETPVANGWFPVGSNRLTLTSTSGFSVGDRVHILRTPTRAWVNLMNLTSAANWGFPHVNPSQNVGEGALNYPVNFERVITAIEGNDIVLNIPMVQGLNIPTDDTAVVRLVDDSRRITDIGIENLRIVSLRMPGNAMSTNRGRTAVRVIGTRDAFVRDTTSVFFAFGHTNLYHNATNVSVLNNSYLSPGVAYSSARLYAFTVDQGTNSLFDGNYAQGARYEFVTGSAIGGPNVFLDGVGEASRIGPENHHRWATGTLFDNISMLEGSSSVIHAGAGGGAGPHGRIGRIFSENRGNNGTGHGWTGNTTVFWNVLSNDVMIGRPPTGQGIAEGVMGIYPGHNMRAQGVASTGSTAAMRDRLAALRAMYGNAHVMHTHNTVNPVSLYRAQVAAREGQPFWNAVPSRPLLQRPMPDTWVNQNFVISGIHDKFAEAVTVYINGIPHNVPLGNEGNLFEFRFAPNLAPGYHSIAASQTIRGVESHLTALRYVNVRGSDNQHNQTPSGFVFTSSNAATQNMLGTPTALPPIPAHITQFAVYEAEMFAINLTWAIPTGANAPANVAIRFTSPEGVPTQFVFPAAQGMARIPGLQAGTDYTFTIVGLNVEGFEGAGTDTMGTTLSMPPRPTPVITFEQAQAGDRIEDGPLALNPNWYFTNSGNVTGNTNAIINDNGNHALQVSSTTTNSAAEAIFRFPEITSGQFEFSYRVWTPNTLNSISLIGMANNGGQDQEVRVITVQSDGTGAGAVWSYEIQNGFTPGTISGGTNSRPSTVSTTHSQWHDVRMFVDMDTHRVTIFINDQVLVQNSPFRHNVVGTANVQYTTITGFNVLSRLGAAGSIRIDDIYMTAQPLPGITTLDATIVEVGDVLTATFIGRHMGFVSFEWLVDGVLVPGHHASTFEILPVHIGQNISVRAISTHETGYVMAAEMATVTGGIDPILFDVGVVSPGATRYHGYGQFAAGETVYIYAGTHTLDYYFVRWTANQPVVFDDPFNVETHFQMIAANVTVTANWASPGALTVVVHGSHAAYTGAGEFIPGQVVTIHAGEQAGYTFAGWTADVPIHFTDSHLPTTTFIMPGTHIMVTAHWEPIIQVCACDPAICRPENCCGLHNCQCELPATTQPPTTAPPTTTEPPTTSPPITTEPPATTQPTTPPTTDPQEPQTPEHPDSDTWDDPVEPTTTPPVEATTIPANDGAVSVPVRVSGNGQSATLQLSNQYVNTIVNGSDDTVSFDLTSLHTLSTVVLPRHAVRTFGNAGLGVEIVLPQGSLAIDVAGTVYIGQVARGTNVDITLYQTHLPPHALVEGQGLVIYKLTISSGGSVLGEISGEIAITVPFAWGHTDDMAVWVLGDDGELTPLAAHFNDTTGLVTFTTSQTGYFIIGNIPTMEHDRNVEAERPLALLQLPPIGDIFIPSVTAPVAMTFAIGHSTHTINGVTYYTDVTPFICPIYDRTMLPLRAIAEGAGATVAFDGATRTVIITPQNGPPLSFVIDMPLYGGMGTPVIINDRTFVPALYVTKALGLTIYWYPESQMVYISQ